MSPFVPRTNRKKHTAPGSNPNPPSRGRVIGHDGPCRDSSGGGGGGGSGSGGGGSGSGGQLFVVFKKGGAVL